jgi:hypothetical protein
MAFSAPDIVQLWEAGCRQHPLDRALTMLAHACPKIDRERLADLTIGQRDALLFDLREQTFGGTLDAFVECPQCGERLEFSLPAQELRSLSGAADHSAGCVLDEEGMQVTFRLPDSRDLAAAVGSGDLEAARAALLQRCVIDARLDGRPVAPIDLPEGVVARIAGRMAACDPAADILLNLECPACHRGWQQPFDIVSFFWAELSSQAKRLLVEVHALAAAYGWGEGEILSMSAARRACYLEMIHG